MISLIEAKNYRCLRYVKQALGPFQVLVGPNASGKTTFLDVVSLLGDLISDGLAAAIEKRTENLSDLVWARSGDGFELAVEARIPDALRRKIDRPAHDTVRYEVSIGREEETNELVIRGETVHLKAGQEDSVQRDLFPEARQRPDSILTSKHGRSTLVVINKTPAGNDNFSPEAESERNKRWTMSYRSGSRKSALGNLPEDESKFPVSTWLKALLSEGVHKFVLNSLVLRRPSAPGQGLLFKPDGSNLPWVVNELEKNSPESLEAWVAHLRTALPDLEKIRTVERPEDRHRYLMLRYSGDLEVPSWMVSDGTLRLLALTLPAYLPNVKGTYLIEEPENGIHPRAVETMLQSLSSVYDAQIIMATHSPVILSMTDSDKVLCFAKTDNGETDIVSGDVHPALQDWQGETTLGTLFAGGVLG